MPDTNSPPLPRWNLSPLFPGIDSDEYRSAFAQYQRGLTQLESQFDALGIRRLPEGEKQTIEAASAALETILPALNDTLRTADTLDAFLYGLITTNSYDAAANAEYSKLELLGTRRQQLFVRLRGWIGSIQSHLPQLIQINGAITEHAYFLREAARQSRYLMSEELESLAAELAVDGGSAFGKLQGNVTSQLKVPFEQNGTTEELPITVIRNFSFAADAKVRERAYHAEQAGWHSIRTPVAAAMNAVKGTALTLAKRRGRDSVLDAALDDNRINRATLDAMLAAIREAFPMFRRYLRAKAKKLGKEQLPWWDIFAPLGSAEAHFDWSAARKFIVEKFGSFSEDLGQFAATAFDDAWIDAEPRDGKRGGAYCMPVSALEQSRVLANFDGSFEQLMTLAHELGHGFHNHCQRGLPMLLRGAPSTLAETASIFCETLMAEEALRQAAPAEQLTILEAQVAGATQVCLDISSRYLFESRVLEQRKLSELSADELCQLMLDAQAETYGDGIVPETYHRYMWLWKPHYYSHDHNFYNFPYAFGHLFGLGLYAVYQREGASFVPRYCQLLRDTGRDDAAPLAARFGIDITQPDFWRGSLRVIAGQVERYEKVL